MATSSSSSEPLKMPQLDYKLRSVIAPRYKLMKLPLNNNTNSNIPIGSSSSTTLEWKLPTRVYNLARSYISYNMHVDKQGASNFGWTFEDLFELGSSITFGSAGGIDLVNLQWLQNYSKIARRLNTPLDDYLGNDELGCLYRSNIEAPANVNPGGSNRVNGVLYGGSDNYVEPKFAMRSALDTPMDRYRQYPLGALTGTLFGVDRDFYSPVEQYLRIQAGIGDKMAFTTTSATVPTTGVASASGGSGITLNNVYLYLAVEQNSVIEQSLMERYMAGQLSFSIPYTTAFRNTGGAANSQTNIQIQLSNQYGKRLKHITHTVWNPQEKFNTAYDCANFDGEKIQMYQTFLDTMPLQDRILSCKQALGTSVNSDDWLENKKFLEKRSAIISKNQYSLNWFHRDQFYEPHTEAGALPDVNLDEGLIMDTPKQWQISATIPNGGLANLVHYTYVEFAREIQITPAGPIFVGNMLSTV